MTAGAAPVQSRTHTSPPGNVGRTAGWGLFCASSWTWCIGLYLPVILLERYGWAAFIAFAVPNVCGCAAFGHVLRTRAASVRFESAHAAATWLFSAVTVGFHLFFVLWLAAELLPGLGWSITVTAAPAGDPAPAAPAALIVSGAGLALAGTALTWSSARSRRAWVWPGIALWIGAMVLAVCLVPAGLGPTGHATAPGGAPAPSAGVLSLVPVIAAGFLLCPFLDLSFHRALRESDSPQSFTIFAIAFAPVLVLTTAIWFGRAGRDGPGPAVSIAAAAALAHVSLQVLFTTAVHLREIRTRWMTVSPAVRMAAGAAFTLPAIAYVTGRITGVPRLGGEAIYLSVLGMYGLVFPAYVLVFAVPRLAAGRTASNLRRFAVAMVLLLPFYEAGFIRDRPAALLIPGAVLVLFVIIRAARQCAVRSRTDADT
ncbi:MAG: hypothetical protein KF817_04575 [Phycisphaeraceae bacterium]|nr:hypothetical protein [Phycisphaeraceae bacterium]